MSAGLLRHDPRYRRLKVGGRGWLGRASYWLGDDHLLVVMVDQFSENYRRFYHRETRMVIVRRTRAWELELGLGALILLATGLPAALLSLNPETMAAGVVFGVLAGGTLIGMLIHGIGGPTCAVEIRTGVQGRELPAIRRIKAADRLVKELGPKILAAQALWVPPPTADANP